MTHPDQLRACEILRTALTSIFRRPDREMLPVELDVIEKQCAAVETFTRDSTDAHAQRWQRAIEATRRLLHDRSDDVRHEWIAAYAELPPMI